MARQGTEVTRPMRKGTLIGTKPIPAGENHRRFGVPTSVAFLKSLGVDLNAASVNGYASRPGLDLNWNSATADLGVHFSAVDRALNGDWMVQVDGS